MAYLFLGTATNTAGARTSALTQFFRTLYLNGLQSPEFLTDKDWAQINTARQTWPTTKIQLCYWHLRRAVKKRLADSSVNTNIYDAEYANREVNFIDVNFHPFPRDQSTGIRSSQNCDVCFCPRELRETILEIISYHFHLHPLLPNDNNQYLTENEIWLLSVREMYGFCVTNDLKNVWAYMWMNWYEKRH